MKRTSKDSPPSDRDQLLVRVAFLVETSTAWGRGIVSGINDYWHGAGRSARGLSLRQRDDSSRII